MIVEKDLTTMSDREKHKLLMKEAPEIFGLISDFTSNLFVNICFLILAC